MLMLLLFIIMILWILYAMIVLELLIHVHDFFISYTCNDFGSVKIENYGVTKIMGMKDVYLETSIED